MVDLKSEVEKAKAHIRKLADKNEITQSNAGYLLDFVEQLSAQGYSLNRQRKYLYSLGKMSKIYNKDFEKATKKDMVTLSSKIRNNYHGETPRDYLVMLRIFIRYIREQGGEVFGKYEYPEEVKWITPGGKSRRKHLPKELFTVEEIKKLANHTDNLRDRCLIMMLYETGCRIGELQQIQIKDIDFDKYGALITVYGKTGARRIRIIASAPSISNWLQEHPDRGNKNKYLFCGIWTNRGEMMQYRYINKLLREIGKRAGIDKPMNPHHFRHSRATELAKKLTEAQLCQYMGWIIGSKEARTYVHLSGRDIDKTILSLHGFKQLDKEEEKFKIIICPRCSLKNDPGSKFCRGCSLGLDEKSIMDYDQRKEEAAKLGFDLISSDTTTQDMINQTLLDQIKILTKEIRGLTKK